MNCFSCHKEIPIVDKIGRREECPHCGADAHVCKNCEFYDPKVYNECRETQADLVKEKDRSNYCDYFAPGSGNGGASEDKAKALKAAAEALFKK